MQQLFDIGDWVYIDKEKIKYGQIIDEKNGFFKIQATSIFKIDESTSKLHTFHPNYNTKWMNKHELTHMLDFKKIQQ